MIPVVIPAYKPDEKLISLLHDLRNKNKFPVIIVNDGSGPAYNHVFDQAAKLSDAIVVHEVNQGQGKAFKTGFDYVLKHYPNSLGVVTADADGQHSISCICKVMEQFKKTPKSLVLGVRNFDGVGIPWKSKFGNKLTRTLFSYVVGIKISDTQTGLRGIPVFFMKDCLTLPGNRFEFATQLLLAWPRKFKIVEVPIQTIYDSVENHQTHFNPVKDSLKIYGVLACQFLKYVFSSLSSFLLDISLFMLFMGVLDCVNISAKILLSTIFSRVLSMVYNYLINYKYVFRSKSSVFESSAKYVSLAIIQMSLSGLFVAGLNIMVPYFSVGVLKVGVDTLLFIISYYVQRRFIFN